MDEIENEELPLETEPTPEVENTETVEELKAKNLKLYARLKKAEGFIEQSDGTWFKKPEAKVDIKPELISSDPVEVASLANALRDLSQEEVDFGKTIARGSNISLLEALKTNEFKTIHKANEAAQRRENSRLGASKGSGQNETVSYSNLPREDHMKAAMEAAKALN